MQTATTNIFRDFLAAVHPNPLVASIAILMGLLLGVALALSDWKSKFAIGSLVATSGSAIASLTSDKVSVVKGIIESTALLTPVLVALNIALGTFLTLLLGGTAVVFTVNYFAARRNNDPEYLQVAASRAFALFASGIQEYATASPDLVARNRIKELSNFNDVLTVLWKSLVKEVATSPRNAQHFTDTIEAIGRFLLQSAFGEGPDLQHYRIAFFVRRSDRLEYFVPINNHDWTAHSMKGFTEAQSFMGEALRQDRPLVYPKDKKRRVPYEERKASRYQSFLVMPVPCGQGSAKHVGAVTVDYTGKDEVFTEPRIEILFAFGQLAYAFYLLNVEGGRNG